MADKYKEVKLDVFDAELPTYWDSMKDIEDLLLKENLLQGKDKSAYLEMSRLFQTDPLKFYEIIKKMENFEEFRILIGLSILDLLFNCPNTVYTLNDTIDPIWRERLILIGELSSKSYMNSKTQENLINSFSSYEFSQLSVRSFFLCMLVYNVEI